MPALVIPCGHSPSVALVPHLLSDKDDERQQGAGDSEDKRPVETLHEAEIRAVQVHKARPGKLKDPLPALEPALAQQKANQKKQAVSHQLFLNFPNLFYMIVVLGPCQFSDQLCTKLSVIERSKSKCCLCWRPLQCYSCSDN